MRKHLLIVICGTACILAVGACAERAGGTRPPVEPQDGSASASPGPVRVFVSIAPGDEGHFDTRATVAVINTGPQAVRLLGVPAVAERIGAYNYKSFRIYIPVNPYSEKGPSAFFSRRHRLPCDMMQVRADCMRIESGSLELAAGQFVLFSYGMFGSPGRRPDLVTLLATVTWVEGDSEEKKTTTETFNFTFPYYYSAA